MDHPITRALEFGQLQQFLPQAIDSFLDLLKRALTGAEGQRRHFALIARDFIERTRLRVASLPEDS